MQKTYKILKDGEIIESYRLGTLTGNKKHRIFGTLDCSAGIKMKKEGRVFFHNMEDAITQGYRPAKYANRSRRMSM
ncbi:MAG TPA: Ada metal-binding domain-containing protein [archaeon]|nr:Ada metal-binding domain-containing protein [archaeon]